MRKLWYSYEEWWNVRSLLKFTLLQIVQAPPVQQLFRRTQHVSGIRKFQYYFSFENILTNNVLDSVCRYLFVCFRRAYANEKDLTLLMPWRKS